MGYRTNWSWLNLSLVLNIIISYLESEGIIYPFYIISSIRCEERKRISFHCEPFWALTIPVFFSLSFFSHRKSSWGNAHFTKLNTNSPDSIISLSECWPTWLSIIVYAMRNKWNEYVLWRINWFWLHCSAHFKKKNQIKDSFHQPESETNHFTKMGKYSVSVSEEEKSLACFGRVGIICGTFM